MTENGSDAPAWAVVFSGQGTQTPHMGKVHHRGLEPFREAYAEAREVLGLDLLAVGEGTGDDFETPEVVQPLLVAFGVASWRSLAATGVRPRILAGHSLGEVAAFVAADALDFESALLFARERGRAMAACPPGAMSVVIGLAADEVAEHCTRCGGGGVSVANRNLPDQVVISGEQAALTAVTEALEDSGAVVKPLRITLAAHSAMMAEAETRLAEYVSGLTVRTPQIPVLSTLTGTELDGPDAVRANLSGAMTRCVDWVAVTEALRERGVERVVECGPRTVLRDLVAAMLPDVPASSVADTEGLALLGIGHEGTDVRAMAERGLRLLIGTPRLMHEPAEMATTERLYARLQEVVDRPEEVEPEQVGQLVDAALLAKGLDENTRARLTGRPVVTR